MHLSFEIDAIHLDDAPTFNGLGKNVTSRNEVAAGASSI
jgi:hypothetical protein